MQTVKVGWVGQPFALARCNDSPGKRTRNRRSKEERKSMIEIFIKKHQKSNSGNFPSLNLTHKEVGGSFYTVREIVREIIQENRILGPGDSTSQVLMLEDHNGQPHERSSLVKLDSSALVGNVHTLEDNEIEDSYSDIEHTSVPEGFLLSSNNIFVGRNSTSNVDMPDKKVEPSPNKLVFQPTEDVVSGYELCLSHENSSFHKSHDVEEEECVANISLKSEMVLHNQMSGENQTGILDDTVTLKEEHQGELLLVTDLCSSSDALSPTPSEIEFRTAIASSSSDAIFPTVGEMGIRVDTSSELSSSSVGTSGSDFTELSVPPPNNVSDEVGVNKEKKVDVFSAREIPNPSISTKSDGAVMDMSESPEVAAMGKIDVSDKSEENLSSFHHINAAVAMDESLGKDSKGEFKGFLEETEFGDIVENKVEVFQDTEDCKIHDVASNVIVDEVIESIKPPVSGLTSDLTEHLTSKISEKEVDSASSDGIFIREESTLTRLPKGPHASSNVNIEDRSQINLGKSSEATKTMLDGTIRRSIENTGKQKQLQQPDPFWDAIKKFVAAFIKFWTE